MKPRRTRLPETCPNCGAQFKAGRLACPECGSDEVYQMDDDGGEDLTPPLDEDEDVEEDDWDEDESGETPENEDDW